MARTIAVLFLWWAICSIELSAQTFVVGGAITDASTGEPLSAATVRIVGTPSGSIANAQGIYRISLAQGDYRVAYSFIGYRTDTVVVHLDRNREVNVSLTPSAIQLAEVVVTGEDPAIAIMRKVIERKNRWRGALKSYQFDAFTRQVIRRDTSIAMISESYSTGYWQEGDTVREVIKQKRQTGNISASQNFAGVGGIVNFYDDEIRFSGHKFVGPTAATAFDYYDFTLEKTRRFNGRDVFIISMHPKSRLRPLFRGTLSIVDEEFALVGVEVSPNEAFRIPFISDAAISYSQQFQLFEGRYWMPVDVRVRGSFGISIVGITFPRIGIEGTSSIYDYKINVAFPDTIKRMNRRVVGIEAEKFDSTYWAQKQVLPLTSEESGAYRKLDSTQTLEKQFQPKGPLVTLANVSEGGILRYVDARFDRVEGFFLGGKFDSDSLTNRIKLESALGYGFSDKKTKWLLGGELFFDARRKISAGMRLYDGITHMPDGDYHSSFSITLSSLLYKDDYRDYYYRHGGELFVKVKPISQVSVQVGVLNEDHRSATQATDYSFFSRNEQYRWQPAIQEGTLRSITFRTHIGQEPLPLNIIPVDYADFGIEHSSPSLLASGFDFTQVTFTGEYRFATMLGSLFLPPTLSIKVSGAASTASLPIQRYVTLDSRYDGFALPGVLRGASVKEFGGDSYALISVEHNFRSTPFLALDVPFLYKNGIELVTYATVARSWMKTPQTVGFGPTDGWYKEIGAGFSRILGLFRLDATYRFNKPSGVWFSLGVATLL